MQTPRVEECLQFCILVFSNTHSCSICIIYNDNYILATDDIIFDNVSMHAWPSNLILTTLADNGLITCAKCSYKLAENLGRRNWTERLKSNSVNSTSIQNILFNVATVLLNHEIRLGTTNTVYVNFDFSDFFCAFFSACLVFSCAKNYRCNNVLIAIVFSAVDQFWT